MTIHIDYFQEKKSYEKLMSDTSLDMHVRKMKIMQSINGMMTSPVPLGFITQVFLYFVLMIHVDDH